MDPEFQFDNTHRRAVEDFARRHETKLPTLVLAAVVRTAERAARPDNAAFDKDTPAFRSLVCDLLARSEAAEAIATTDDACIVVFAVPADAVRFALRMQTEYGRRNGKAGATARLRIAVHTHELLPTDKKAAPPDDDELIEQTDVASRLLALARGGQIVLTRRAFDVARTIVKGGAASALPPLVWWSHGLLDLGEIGKPVEVCEVGAANEVPARAGTNQEMSRRRVVSDRGLVAGWRPGVDQAVPGSKYVLVERLASGGFGETWLGHNARTKQLAALEFCFRVDRLPYFRREMELLRALDRAAGARQNVVSLLGGRLGDPPYYLELEYVRAATLADWIEARQGFDNVPMDQRLAIGVEIARALAGVHEAGVVHRDIRPANILIRESVDGPPGVLLTGFGAGHLVDDRAVERDDLAFIDQPDAGCIDPVGRSSSAVHVYEAPELTCGDPPSPQSDIYSLGVLLYQLATGDLSRPLTADWERGVGDKLLRDDIRRCVASDPRERFGRAAELAEKLRALPKRRAALAEHEAAERARSRRNRLDRALATAAGLLVLVVVAFGLGWFAARREKERVVEPHQLILAEKESAERQLYFANLRLAERAIEKLDFSGAHELLDDCPRSLRHWEWGRLQHLARRGLLTLYGHTRPLGFVTLSSDGRRVATSSADGTARIWDADTGRAIHVLDEHTESVWSVLFSPDGRRVVTASEDETAKIWDAESGTLLRTLEGHTGWVRFAMFSPDGRRIATAGNDRTARIWDAETGLEILALPSQPRAVAFSLFSPQGGRLLTVSHNRTPEIWDSVSGKHLFALKGHSDLIWHAMFSHDGRWIATASQDRTAMIWDAATGKQLHSLEGHGREVVHAHFSVDGGRIVTASLDGTAKIWDTQSGRLIHSLEGHGNSVVHAAFSPDGRRVATTSMDKTAKIWNAETGRELLTLEGHSFGVHSPLFFPDSRRLVTGGWDGTAKIWDTSVVPGPRRLKPSGARLLSLVWSRDGRRLVAVDRAGTATVWNAETGCTSHSLDVSAGGMNAAACSANGSHVATVAAEGAVRIRDVESTTTPLTIAAADTDALDCIALSPDGGQLVTGSRGGAVGRWDITTGSEALELWGWRQRGPIVRVAFSRDGKYVAAASKSGTITIHEVDGEKRPRRLKHGGKDVRSIALSRDGGRVASLDRYGTAVVWDRSTGRRRSVVRAPMQDDIESAHITLSPDGKRLAMTRGPSVIVWDAESGHRMLDVEAPDGRTLDRAVFSPDGRRLAASSGDGQIWIWQTLPWRREDLPGDARMSYNERIRLHKVAEWKRRRRAKSCLVQPDAIEGPR